MVKYTRVLSRLLYIVVWFAIGYFPYNDFYMGLLSSICALAAMEVLYYLDRKFSGIDLDSIVTRLDYLDETLVESQKTKTLILEELMILEDNIIGNDPFAEGERTGIEESKEVVRYRFNKVAEELAKKHDDAEANDKEHTN